MDRSVLGDFTIGGRGSNRNFHGRVASWVVTTLRRDQPMPTEAEVKMMITDPDQWELDYRVGQIVRRVSNAQETTYSRSSQTAGFGGTHMLQFGDGTNDSLGNGIRNQVLPSEQNLTKHQLNSMQENDFINVTIPGLSA